ncbi:MAG TPA: hypothetical protein PLU22_08120, partial [Polyangiaceae bacterium]|nr:hypothetical protein [Polyangiaceae bacterium]
LAYMVDLYLRSEIEGNSLAKAAVFTGVKAVTFQCTVRLTPWGRAFAKGQEVERWPDGERQAGPTWREMVEEYEREQEVRWPD